LLPCPFFLSLFLFAFFLFLVFCFIVFFLSLGVWLSLPTADLVTRSSECWLMF
jgi:hypothetical protein